MENDILQKMDLVPNLVAVACRILAGWKNWYGKRNNRFTETNDSIAFAITDEVKTK